MVADYESTARAVKCCGVVEGNPFFGKHLSRKRLCLQGGAINGGIIVATYFLKKMPNKDGSHDRAWIIAAATNIGLHMYAVVSNLGAKRNANPSSCSALGAGC